MLVHYTFIFIYDLPYSIPDRNNFYSNRMRRMCSCHGKYKISLPLVYIQIYKVDKSILTNQNSLLYYCCIGHVQGIQKIIYVHWTWHKSNLKAEKRMLFARLKTYWKESKCSKRKPVILLFYLLYISTTNVTILKHEP